MPYSSGELTGSDGWTCPEGLVLAGVDGVKAGQVGSSGTPGAPGAGGKGGSSGARISQSGIAVTPGNVYPWDANAGTFNSVAVDESDAAVDGDDADGTTGGKGGDAVGGGVGGSGGDGTNPGGAGQFPGGGGGGGGGFDVGDPPSDANTDGGQGADGVLIISGTQTPNAPTGLTASPISSHAMLVRWTNNSGINTGFTIRRSTHADFSSGNTDITGVPASATTYRDTGLTEGATYYYEIKATGTDANSANSASVGGTTHGPPTAARKTCSGFGVFNIV